ncbi:S-layer homology domain-containing protein [Paenibacillus alkalitolerans]|uniref:S-layer homology domain-containing protein n=1 Tax=Paenibacillus alkalitolerans TaxID=2799335 RepID=UPI0018F30561|nr:S-layer homology domain-containing protein [Paenibacillus alkalitolerans]
MELIMERTNKWFRKLSGAMALMLTVSLLIPMLAYAQAYIFKAAYNRSTGTVTASVYTDETVASSVYLNVYDNNMNVIGSVFLKAPSGTHTIGNAVYDRYDFTYKVTANVHDALKLTSWYAADPDGNGTVTSDVYTVRSSHNNGGGGGHWPGTPAPGAIDGKVTADRNGGISADELAGELAAYNTVTIDVSESGIALLPAKPLIEAAGDRTLMLINGGISLELPVGVIHFDNLAKITATDKEKLTIRAKIAPLKGSELNKIDAEARAAGAKLVSEPVEFALTALGDLDHTAEIDDFRRTYVKRTLPINAPVADAAKLAGVVYDEAAKRFHFVPTSVTQDEDGKVSAAVLKRPGNSVYAVIQRDKTFNDIAGHWAEDNIEAMAGKLIVEGVTPLRFEPNRDITRAEFAALLVRALGIKIEAGSSADSKFSDVAGDAWYRDIVSAAVDAELIHGYPDGTFGPNKTITRAEMAAMMSRALAFAGGSGTSVEAETVNELLSKFRDRSQLRWAEKDFAIVIRAGIVQGMTETTLAPRSNATRAQAAAMLHRFLDSVDFI